MSKPGVDEDIFWGHVEKSTDSDGCWIWTGSNSKPFPNAAVYGKYTHRGVAHRVAYELLVGPIPEGLELDHLCRVTLCVNPAHLEPVTRAENQRRRSAARTHCKHGHALTPDNIAPYAKGRACLTCARRRSREAKRRQAVA